MRDKEKTVGLTKDVGWQFGLRKTFQYSQENIWDFMFSDKGLRIWLGELEERLKINRPFKTREGIEGVVSVFKLYSHIRMKWKLPDWENMSTVQVRVMGDNTKATIGFHQEKLLDNDQREEMRLYWNKKMAEIEKVITNDI